MTARCRLCYSSDLATLLDAGSMPIAHRLLDSPDAAEETFPFHNFVCENCGLVQIVDPIDPALLYKGYNYNFSSWKLEVHQDDELNRIFANCKPRKAAEIGCNDGKFLNEVRLRGTPLCVGIEPNPVQSQMARERGLIVFNSWVEPELCRSIVAEHGRFDLVQSRQVLEHVPNVDKFFDCVDILLADDGLLFIDVPDFAPALGQGDCSVMWEEHCTYFTGETLKALLRKKGFEPFDTAEYDFAGGTVAMLSRRGKTTIEEPKPQDAPVTLKNASEYASNIIDYSNRLGTAIQQAKGAGMLVVMYGVGVRGCAAANILGLAGKVEYAIDDQKERQGKYMPGSHLPIRPSETLAAIEQPVLCLLAVNNEYEAMARARLSSVRKGRVEYATLCAPANIWSDLERIEQLFAHR
jgi:SAM-dependent methyltransferase